MRGLTFTTNQKKMTKNKKTKNILLLVGILVLVSTTIIVFLLFKNGQKPKTNIGQQKTRIEQTINNEQIKNPFEENSVQASMEDLKIDEQILAIGEEDENKIVVAEKIYIGFSQEDLRNQMPQQPRQANGSVNPAATTSARNFSLPNGMTMEEMQNLSPEERQRFREEMMANGNFQPRRQANRTADVFVGGRIIDLGEKIITVELETGGSKIVLYSSETQIFKKKES